MFLLTTSATTLVAIVVVLALSSPTAQANRVVYCGLDPSSTSHCSDEPEAGVLVANMTRWAGGSTDPVIGYLEEGSGFGKCLTTLLNAAGFTSMTLLNSSNLTTIDLSVYDVLYFGPTTSQAEIANYVAAASKIQSYVNAGGGLVVEPEVFAGNSWSWVPFANQIGHSGSTNVCTEVVTITAPSHPVMAGLTNAGLSRWSCSVHTYFANAEAAGFEVLAVDTYDRPAIIAIPEPCTVLLLGIGGLALVRKHRIVNCRER